MPLRAEYKLIDSCAGWDLSRYVDRKPMKKKKAGLPDWLSHLLSKLCFKKEVQK